MEWDHLFEDLEGQLASEWEAERAALDAESERLRISKLDLRDRLAALCVRPADIVLEIGPNRRLQGRLRTIGADWVAIAAHDGPRMLVVPVGSITAVGTDHGSLLDSLDDAPLSALRARMTLGFVLRDLARRRVPVGLALHDGTLRHGTIDRAGADHLDIALHDAGEFRRTSTVHGFRIVPYSALHWIQVEPADALLP